MDKEADSVGAWEQQTAADPRKCSEFIEQEDDFGTEKEEVERQLQELWEINNLNQDQPERIAAGNEQTQW